MKRLRCALVLGLLQLMVTPLWGQTTNPNATVNVNAGALTITHVNNVTFADVTLNGTDQSPACTGTPTLTLTDARGSGVGWNVTVSATNFISGPNSIAGSGFTFTGPGGTVTTLAGNAQPTQSVVAATALNPGGFKILSAAVNQGMGSYTYTPANGQFALNVPASTFAGSYTSTMTFTIASGP
ncbi:MAG: WxL domain-containing protein, partial [Candidatus Eremiobacterota bacterium]